MSPICGTGVHEFNTLCRHLPHFLLRAHLMSSVPIQVVKITVLHRLCPLGRTPSQEPPELLSFGILKANPAPKRYRP